MGFIYINSKQQKYFLHRKKDQKNFFFFCKEIKEQHVFVDMPDNYEIRENPRTSLPLLRRKKE